jgi:ribosomal protein L14E/L6E/L27E
MGIELLGTNFSEYTQPTTVTNIRSFRTLQVRKTIRPAKVREALQPGTILILLAGRFRGKRVVLLKHLDQGVLLVTGPFKINGVPLRRVNARYVIATSKRIDIAGVDAKTIEKVSTPDYFTKEKKANQKSEEAFFKQGEKPEVRFSSLFLPSTTGSTGLKPKMLNI